jgi:hypothetical protein
LPAGAGCRRGKAGASQAQALESQAGAPLGPQSKSPDGFPKRVVRDLAVSPSLDRTEFAGCPGGEQEPPSVPAQDQDGRTRARNGGKTRLAAKRAENVVVGSTRIDRHLRPSRFLTHLYRRRPKN